MKTSVFVIDDDWDFSKVLLNLLATSPLLDVAGVAASVADAQRHIGEQSNDVYLVDISLPDGSGIDLMRYIRQRQPLAKILALSTLGDEKHIQSSLQAGAAGYLLKSEMPANIIQSIISLVNDGGYLSGHASKVLIQLLNRQQPTNTAHRTDQNSGTSSPSSVTMTKKEHEVLNNIQTGLPAKVIADRMGISIFTVNQHLRSIYQKLNARNKMEAVQSAREKGLL
jgi:DNA-binding NarL/FixJ family response regulator